MSHCHDEHEDHGHDHSEGAAHDHTDDLTPALQNHIYEQVDFSAINTLNESASRAGERVVQKTWTERLEAYPELCSDADEQLLMHVPFTAQIRLHSILIRTSATDSAPQTLKVFINRDDLDFFTVSSLPATQTLELAQTNDVQEVPVKRALFNTVRSLDLFFEDNWSQGEEDVTRISYVGFKGEWMKLNREPINFLYEPMGKIPSLTPHVEKLRDIEEGLAKLQDDLLLFARESSEVVCLQVAPVEIIVGADQRKFYVHERILRSHSSFFNAALSKAWKEGAERQITLPEADADAFNAYVHWLYDRKSIVVEGFGAAFVYLLYAKMYAFGEQILDSMFQDAVITAIVETSRRPSSKDPRQRTFPDNDAIEIIYDQTPLGSPARRLFVDFFVKAAVPSWIVDTSACRTNHGFSLELATELLRSRRVTVLFGGMEKDYQELLEGSPCSYHKHGKDEPCSVKS
ncbi:hypothetical protein LTR08_008770 [Meristemomyces frigidus]|nr:hypothetical protein LTR08_008770 [Meristemomyces frigidus]